MLVEDLVHAKPFLIQQDYAAYTAEQQAVWAELVRRGLVRMPTIAPDAPLPPRTPPTMSFEELMRDLDESRSDR